VPAVGERGRQIANEHAKLDPFEALAGDVPPGDQHDLMERPFFSLAKAKRLAPILYQVGDTQVQVYALPEHGMATIWDADVLIWAASQILAAQDRGLPNSRFFRFTPYQLLIAIGRATGSREYQLLKRALTRLQSTVIRSTIRHGEHWRRQQFSWINEWEELTTRSGRCEGMEFVLPEWSYQGVLDRRLVLAIDPAYFALSGGIERWLYHVARKHAGRRRDGWQFELRHLHAKSASLARFSDFALDIRRIVARHPSRAMRSRYNAMTIAVSSSLCDQARPQGLWKSCGLSRSISGLQAQHVSGLRAHPHRDFGRTNCCQVIHRATNLARLKTLNQSLNLLLLRARSVVENDATAPRPIGVASHDRRAPQSER
jgi:plasmid replication initiation protein